MDGYTKGILGIVALFAIPILYYCLSNGVQFLFPKTKHYFDKAEERVLGKRETLAPGELPCNNSWHMNSFQSILDPECPACGQDFKRDNFSSDYSGGFGG